MRRFAAASLLFLACAPFASVRAADPSFEATVSVADPVLPGPRKGARDLMAAFGKQPGAAIRALMEAELRDLNAFREVVAQDGQTRVEVRIESARHEHRELGGQAGETPDQLEVSMQATFTWSRGETTLHVVPLSLTRKHSLDARPTRNEIHTAFRDLVQEATERAFSSLYEATTSRKAPGLGRD